MILAVDTALPIFSVALVRDRITVAALALEGKESRNEKLLPAIDWLLGQAGASLSDVSLLVATRGPGSFTGVRVGLATMQGLALATGRPLCALSTHEAVALGRGCGDTAVFGDAGRNEIYLSLYQRGEELAAPALAQRTHIDEIDQSFVRLDLDKLIRSENVAVYAAQRAAQLEGEGKLASRADATPVYVRLAEAEVILRQKRDA